jgi:hypothetical protein
MVVKGKVFPPDSNTGLDLFVDPVTLHPSSDFPVLEWVLGLLWTQLRREKSSPPLRSTGSWTSTHVLPACSAVSLKLSDYGFTMKLLAL